MAYDKKMTNEVKLGRPKKVTSQQDETEKLEKEIKSFLAQTADDGVTGNILIECYQSLSVKQRQAFLNMVKATSDDY